MSLGAQLGPNLTKAIASFPPWLQARFHDEGDALQQAAFAGMLWPMGYGRLSSHGLPADASALTIMLNPSASFWTSTAQRKTDRDYAVAHAPKLTTSTHWTLGPLEGISKIPVLGSVVKAAASPVTTIAHIAEGERIDHALLDAAKDQLGQIKALAPYAATIVSFVPGIGTGVAAAIAAGAALAEGKPIDQALEDAVKAAIPGGAIVAAGFELAKKVASGENVGKAALESARAGLPPDAQKAFDVGLALVSGKQLQSAITSAITSLAPGELKQILDVGAKAVQSVPGLADVAKNLSSDIERQGLQLASGALAHAGVNEAQIRAMRSKLTGDVLHGFDAALKAQTTHYPWLKNVVDQPATTSIAAKTAVAHALQTPVSPQPAPHASEPTPTQKAPHHAAEPAKTALAPNPAAGSGPAYPPYPRVGVLGDHPAPRHCALSGAGYPPYPTSGAVGVPPHHPHGGGWHPVHHALRQSAHHWPSMWGIPYEPDGVTVLENCRVWGAPVELPPTMQPAALVALSVSKGQPATVHGPNGALYLVAFENGAMTARPCAS
jgi:hypothetical protein